MAQVTVRINGYAYTLACQDGEEQHLLDMAADVDRRIDAIRQSAGQSGEARMLVMAALLIADDLYEARRNQPDAAPAQKITRRVSRAAKRAEDIAQDLEQS